MNRLEALVREAGALAASGEGGVSAGGAEGGVSAASTEGGVPADAVGADVAEASRLLQICNACRYCEGFCAVFPAMTRRLAFGRADVEYLANLCHGCGACLHACQYAPPHEFAVNVPRAMARVRRDTWAAYAWPSALGALYRRNGTVLALALAAGCALFLALAAALHGTLRAPGSGGFYDVFPHGLMAGLFAPVFGYALLALGMGVWRFWHHEAPGPASPAAVGEAAHHALRLTYLDGGHGEGCNNADDRWTPSRRIAHHLAFYGFLLCFAATVAGTLLHYGLGRPAPYPPASLPKLLGIPGGLALAAGTAALFVLHLRRHPLHREPSQRAMDLGFIALLFLAATSGLALLPAAGTAALVAVLCVHLGSVMALFLTLPYGKFAHAAYRSAALLKWAIERRQPNRLQLGDE